MKVFDIAAVTDRGDYYEVNYLTTSLTKELRGSQKYLGLNISTAKLIKRGLDNSRIINIIKDYQDIDVQPHDIIVSEIETDNLTIFKKIHTQRIRQQVTHQQANVSGIMIYEFIHINNYLCDKGFFIHDDNREDVYIQILDTGDETLINKLEIYLNAKDYIGRASSLEQKYFDLYSEILLCVSEEEVTKLYIEFMEYDKSIKIK